MHITSWFTTLNKNTHNAANEICSTSRDNHTHTDTFSNRINLIELCSCICHAYVHIWRFIIGKLRQSIELYISYDQKTMF